MTVFAGPGSDPSLDVQRDPRPLAPDQRGGPRRRQHDRGRLARGASRLPHARCSTSSRSSAVRRRAQQLPASPADRDGSRRGRRPMVTTLHTPPTPWLESAIQAGPCPVTFVAVSEHTARAWRPSASCGPSSGTASTSTVWPPGSGRRPRDLVRPARPREGRRPRDPRRPRGRPRPRPRRPRRGPRLFRRPHPPAPGTGTSATSATSTTRRWRPGWAPPPSLS